MCSPANRPRKNLLGRRAGLVRRILIIARDHEYSASRRADGAKNQVAISHDRVAMGPIRRFCCWLRGESEFSRHLWVRILDVVQCGNVPAEN